MSIIKTLNYVFLCIVATLPLSADKVSAGFGIGAMYSGIGVNITSSDENSLYYATIGCMEHSPNANALCGPGIGYITTNYWDKSNTKHGLGIHYGVVGGDTYMKSNGEIDWDEQLGISVGYYYFNNGINNTGLTSGITINMSEDRNTNTDYGVMLQLGYQF